jgi:hypothetical protein
LAGIEQAGADHRVVAGLDADAQLAGPEIAPPQRQSGGLGHLLSGEAHAALQRQVGDDQAIRVPRAAIEGALTAAVDPARRR